MRNIFVGLLLISLDFNLTFDQLIIGLIPDFVGYFILHKGLLELTALEESIQLERCKPIATKMIYFTAILYGLDFFGITPSLGVVERVLGLISLFVYLWILYQIIQGILVIQEKYRTDMNGERLLTLWKIIVVLDVIVIVLNMFPYLAIFIAFFNIAVTIYLLVLINQTAHIYDCLNQSP